MAACLVVCVVALLLVADRVVTFNLEPRIPVIKNGPQMSFFGYSVALHQAYDDRLGSRDTVSWMLAGAPRGQNLQPGSEGSGALFKCPVTTLTNDCIQVPTDGRRAGDNTQLFPPLASELKNEQWLGVTVNSQGVGGKVLVCAHRYIQRNTENTFQWGDGLCYTLKPNLKFNNAWRPCMNEPKRLGPEQFGFCQAGTSGILTDDDMTLLGMPGPHTWRGTVFAVNVSDDFLLRDKTQYLGPVTNQDSPVDKYSYLGMSVAYGRFFPHIQTKSFVGGAPRSQGTGQVVFFSQARKTVRTLRVDLILDGELFSSQFGYTMCAMDVDNNGMSDLIVAAPFHFTDLTGGAIYIYGTPQSGLTKNTPYKRILGPLGSRFGYALADAGDLNQDGFNDLAVGAPFDSGGGSVSIFLGGQRGLSEIPSQVIRAADMAGGAGIMTFGYALSGGVDMDDNGYPDLLVGSFCNDTIAMIRSRPIVAIVTKVEDTENLNNIDPSVITCSIQPNSDEKCVSFRTCIKRETLDRLDTTVNLNYQLEAETFQAARKFSRVRFHGGLASQSHIVRTEISLRQEHTSSFYCRQEHMFIKKDTRDIQTPIQLRITYSLIQRAPKQVYPGGELPNIDQFPILDQQQASRVFTARFIKNCGPDDRCQSSLTARAEFDLPTDNSGVAVLELGVMNELRVNVSVTNNHESAYDARLIVKHNRHMSFIGKEPKDNIACITQNDETLVCYLGNPFDKGRRQLSLRFDVTSLSARIEEQHAGLDRLQVQVSVNTTSEQIVQDFPRVLSAQLARRSEISISGVARPEQSFYGGEGGGVERTEAEMQYLDQIGSAVVHTYEVYNAGPSTADWIDVHIDWPYQTNDEHEHDGWLLYLTRAPFVEGDGECYLDNSHINPLNLAQREEEPTIVSSSVIGAYAASTYDRSSKKSSSSEYSSKSTKESSRRVNTKYQQGSGSLSTSINSIGERRQKGGQVWSGENEDDRFSSGRNQTSFNEYSDRTRFTSTEIGDSGARGYTSGEAYSEYGPSSGDRSSSRFVTSSTKSSSLNSQNFGGNKGSDFGTSGDDQRWSPSASDDLTPLQPSIKHRGSSSRQSYSATSERSFTASSSVFSGSSTAFSDSSTESSVTQRYPGLYSDRFNYGDTGGGATYRRYDSQTRTEHVRPLATSRRVYKSRQSDATVLPSSGYYSRRKLQRGRTEGARRRRVKTRLTSDVTTESRQRRSVTSHPPQALEQSARHRNLVKLDCAGSARCVRFRCRVHRLPAKKYALVHVQARLWNSTLQRLYWQSGTAVAVISSGSLSTRPDMLQLQNITDDFGQAETLAYSDAASSDSDGGVPVWAIVLAVLAGLLLLALLALLLWKLGFFQRRRPRPPNKRR